VKFTASLTVYCTPQSLMVRHNLNELLCSSSRHLAMVWYKWAAVFRCLLRDGDVVVLATDELFDNVHD